jgi:hypothetical protein
LILQAMWNALKITFNWNPSSGIFLTKGRGLQRVHIFPRVILIYLTECFGVRERISPSHPNLENLFMFIPSSVSSIRLSETPMNTILLLNYPSKSCFLPPLSPKELTSTPHTYCFPKPIPHHVSVWGPAPRI